MLQKYRSPQTIMRGVRNRINAVRGGFVRRRNRRLAVQFPLPSVPIDGIAPPCPTLPPPILDDACMPPLRYQPHDDFGALMRIVADRQPRLIVELGTAHGNTVANICRVNAECRVVTVNAPVELQSGLITSYSLTRDEIGRVYRNHGYGDRVTQVFQNTLCLGLSQYVSEGSVDLAVIDACHDKEYVINDFLKCIPFLSQNGLILLHDTHPSMAGHLDGSYLACAYLRKQGFDVHHIEDTWWGVFSPNGVSMYRKK